MEVEGQWLLEKFESRPTHLSYTMYWQGATPCTGRELHRVLAGSYTVYWQGAAPCTGRELHRVLAGSIHQNSRGEFACSQPKGNTLTKAQ
jgi:hypothetical protein